MVHSRLLENLAPVELARDAVTLNLLEFVTRYGDAPFLLVRVTDGDEELELGLSASVPTNGAARSKSTEPLPFRTALQPAEGRPRASSKARREEPDALRRLLDRHAHFGVSVRKRGDDALFMDRVSVGRARNKDIVLRHSTISKFHAWFELNDTDTMYVCDAGSTNLTYVNERWLEARVRTPVEPGDAIRFGAVMTLLSSPTALWTAFHAGSSSSLSAGVAR